VAGRRSTYLTVAALAAATAALATGPLAGCASEAAGGGDDPAPSAPATGTGAEPPTPSTVTFPTGGADAGSLTIRTVLAGATDGAAPPALPTLDELGPAVLDGTGVAAVTAVSVPMTGEWVVLPVLSGSGLAAFNEAAAACHARAPSCPSGQVAVVLDGEVLMAATVQEPSFEADQIQVSAGWTEPEALAVAERMAAAAHGS
jgi:preprotein translocase subunit SecD